MRAVRHPRVALVPLLLLAPWLSACSDDDGDAPEKPFAYTADLEAPSPREYSEDGGDTTPDRDGAIVELELDSGADLVVWIDPDDIRQVLVQHSDPDDPEAWTERRRIFAAGDGCLSIGAGTDGTTVAVALDCYRDDAFGQQAPDQGTALVTTDLRTWDVDDELGEFSCDEPEVTGGEVTFVNDIYEDRTVTWDPEDGFASDDD